MALTAQDLMGIYGKASIGSGIGGLAGGLFSKSPMSDANKYLNQIPGQVSQYYQPYFNAGQQALPQLQEQYSNLVSNPGEKFNQIGQSFHQSPGFKFALDQALGSAGRAAAAGGMAGSPAHQQEAMQLATQLGNQDYYNYLSGATDLYGKGLGGQQTLANMGQQAGQGMSDQIANVLAQQANLAARQREAKNRGFGGAFGNLLGGLMAFL